MEAFYSLPADEKTPKNFPKVPRVSNTGEAGVIQVNDSVALKFSRTLCVGEDDTPHVRFETLVQAQLDKDGNRTDDRITRTYTALTPVGLDYLKQLGKVSPTNVKNNIYALAAGLLLAGTVIGLAMVAFPPLGISIAITVLPYAAAAGFVSGVSLFKARSWWENSPKAVKALPFILGALAVAGLSLATAGILPALALGTTFILGAAIPATSLVGALLIQKVGQFIESGINWFKAKNRPPPTSRREPLLGKEKENTSEQKFASSSHATIMSTFAKKNAKSIAHINTLATRKSIKDAEVDLNLIEELTNNINDVYNTRDKANQLAASEALAKLSTLCTLSTKINDKIGSTLDLINESLPRNV